MKARLDALATGHEAIGEIRGRGLLVGIEFVRDRETREPFPESFGFTARLVKALRDRNVLVAAGAPQSILGRHGRHISSGAASSSVACYGNRQSLFATVFFPVSMLREFAPQAADLTGGNLSRRRDLQPELRNFPVSSRGTGESKPETGSLLTGCSTTRSPDFSEILR